MGDLGSIPGTGNQEMALGSFHASNKIVQVTMNPPGIKIHGQSHLKSEIEGTIGPTKWTSVQQKN